MRSITSAEAAVLAAQGRAYLVRVLVADAAGVERDVDEAAQLGGQRWLVDVKLSDDAEQQGQSAEVTLKRAIFNSNLSPFMASSGPAFQFANPLTATSAKALDLNRRVRIQYALGPADSTPSSNSLVSGWTDIFLGRVDTIRVADGQNIVLECRDQNVVELSDAFFERERIYGLTPAGYTYQRGALMWAESESYALNDIVVPAHLNGYLYRVTAAGTTAATEPSWPTTVGNTVSNGTVTFRCEIATASSVTMETVLQQMMNDSPRTLSQPTLYVPDASGFNLTPWAQSRQPILEAMRTVAQLIGWDVRPRWVAASSAFRMQLWKPDRAKTTPDATFAASDYLDVSKLDVSIEEIRNVVKVIYPDAADLGTDGKTPRRKYYTAIDSGSVSTYGRRYMEIAEEATSQIDTAAEAQTLANAALADLATPYADMSVEAFFFPWTEIGDLFRFNANGQHFDSAQDLAVVGFAHAASVSEDGEVVFRTSLTVRGKPSAGSGRWLQWDVRPGVAPSHDLQNSQGGLDLSVVGGSVVGGARFRISEKLQRLAKFDGFEIHLSTTPGFTPSVSTLAGFTKASELEVANLNVGTTYYARAVPRMLNAGRIVQTPPSAQVSFTPGAVTAATIADYAITTPKLSRVSDPSGAAVSTVNVQDLAIQTSKLDNLAVTSGKLNDLAVTTAKLDGLAVTEAKLGPLAVTNGKLGNLSVDVNKLADLSVATAKLQDSAVTDAKVSDYSITGRKLDDGPPVTPYQSSDGSYLGTLALQYSAGIWAWNGVSVNPADIQQNAIGTTFKLTGIADPYYWTGFTYYSTTTRSTPTLLIRYKTGAGTWPSAFTCRVFGASGYTGGLTYAPSNKTFTAYGDGQWHTAEVDLSDWGSTTLVGTYVIRLDFPDSFTPTANATFTIGYMALGASGGGLATDVYAAEGRVGLGGYPTSYPVELFGATGVKWGLGASGYVSGALAVEAINDSGVFQHAAFVASAFSWWRTGAAQSMALDSSGRLGVGVSSPTFNLHVRGPASPAGGGVGTFGLTTPGAAQGERSSASFYSTFQATADNGPRRTADLVAGFNGGSWGNEYLALHVGSNGSANDAGNLTSEKVRIQSNGYVGIGQSAPANRLDVATLNNWDLTNTEGDMRVGDATYRLKFGIANAGGGAGAASIAAVGGVNTLKLGSGTTSTKQAAITITDGVTVITEPSWIAPALLNSFLNYNATTYQAAGYYKDSSGRVFLRGLLSRASAALNTAVFQLPAGYRPAKQTLFGILANNFNARLDIDTSGNVFVSAADNASWFSFFTLDGVNFDTR